MFSDIVFSQTAAAFDLAAADNSPHTPRKPADGDWSIADDYAFQYDLSQCDVSSLRIGDSIRFRTDAVSNPRHLAQWREGYVYSNDVLTGLHGIRWFNCAGPFDTIEEEVSSDLLDLALQSMQCEIVRPGGGYDHAGRQSETGSASARDTG